MTGPSLGVAQMFRPTSFSTSILELVVHISDNKTLLQKSANVLIPYKNQNEPNAQKYIHFWRKILIIFFLVGIH